MAEHPVWGGGVAGSDDGGAEVPPARQGHRQGDQEEDQAADQCQGQTRFSVTGLNSSTYAKGLAQRSERSEVSV